MARLDISEISSKDWVMNIWLRPEVLPVAMPEGLDWGNSPAVDKLEGEVLRKAVQAFRQNFDRLELDVMAVLPGWFAEHYGVTPNAITGRLFLGTPPVNNVNWPHRNCLAVTIVAPLTELEAYRLALKLEDDGHEWGLELGWKKCAAWIAEQRARSVTA